MESFLLPSPIQQLHTPLLKEKGVEVYVKRDDLIHVVVSGNKWRKLSFNIEEAKKEKATAILTFGGAFSNHLVATAYAGKMAGLLTIGIVRGEQPSKMSHTLKKCKELGMELHFLSRSEYRKKEAAAFFAGAEQKLNKCYMIPEGGANEWGVRGCENIMKEVEDNYDVVCCAAGTATTAAGVLKSMDQGRLMVFPALKGVSSHLRKEVLRYQTEASKETQLYFMEGYDFGGYAKLTQELIEFVRSFYQENNLKLDLVYTAKLFFGLWDLIKKDYFPPSSKILVIHTGGLQGNKGFEDRYKFNLFS